jgi:hypothetical protein
MRVDRLFGAAAVIAIIGADLHLRDAQARLMLTTTTLSEGRMNNAHQEQIEFWNRLGQRWVAYQESLDLVWQPLGDTAIERAAMLAGEPVVGVGLNL